MAGDHRDVPPRIPVVQLLIDLTIGVVFASGVSVLLYAVGRAFWRIMALPALLVVMVVGDAGAATYYINGRDANSHNQNNGLAANLVGAAGVGAQGPWRNIGKANSTLTAGDTVIILSLLPADSGVACGASGNCIAPTNSGSGYVDTGYQVSGAGAGPIVYWGADTIGVGGLGPVGAPPEPLNLPVNVGNTTLTTGQTQLDRKNYIVIRGVNLARGLNARGLEATPIVGTVVQACSLRNQFGKPCTMKLEAAQKFRMDSCSARFKQTEAGSGYNFCMWLENGHGDFSTTAAVCLDDTFRFNSWRMDSIRFGDNWAIRFKFFPRKIWFLNNNIEITVQTGGSSGGQQPHGIVHEESHYVYWYNNNISFIGTGTNGGTGNECRLWAIRSGTRRCRIQNNTIRVYNTGTSPAIFDFNLSQGSEVITAQWDFWYGDHDPPKYNAWVENRFYINAPSTAATDPDHAALKWYTTATKDSFCGNVVYNNGGVPLMCDQGVDSLTIDHNTFFSDSSFAFGINRSGCSTPFVNNPTRIRYNVFANSLANAFNPPPAGADSCGVIGNASKINVIGLDSFSPLLIMDYNLFYSQRTRDSTSAIGFCGGTQCPIAPTGTNRWGNPAPLQAVTAGTSGWSTLNLSPGSNLVNFGPGCDRTSPFPTCYVGHTRYQMRPDEITTLVASNPTASSVDLQWTATGADSIYGRASRYDVRYTTDPDEFDRADMTEAGSEPVPGLVGTVEHFTVEGLAPATTYYFHIWAVNFQENYSEINVGPAASATTL